MEVFKCPNKEHNLFCMMAVMLKVLGRAVMRKWEWIRKESGWSQEAVAQYKQKKIRTKVGGGRAWQAIVHGVTKSQTRLSDQAQHKRDGEEGTDWRNI